MGLLTRLKSEIEVPEDLVIGKIGGKTYAFIGLERIGGIMIYDISDPFHPVFQDYVNNRDFGGDPEQGTAGDLAPEGSLVINLEPDGPGRRANFASTADRWHRLQPALDPAA